MLVVCVLFDLGIYSVVRLELFVVAIEAWTAYSLPLLGDLRLRLVRVHLPEVVVLLERVRQVLRVEVVTLLVRLVDGAVALVLRVRQLDDVLLVDVGTVFGVLTLVERRTLEVIVHNLLSSATATIYRPIRIVTHVLVDNVLALRHIKQFFKFLLSRDEGLVAQVPHHRILNARPGQVLNLLLLMVVHVVDRHRLLVVVRVSGALVLQLLVLLQ